MSNNGVGNDGGNGVGNSLTMLVSAVINRPWVAPVPVETSYPLVRPDPSGFGSNTPKVFGAQTSAADKTIDQKNNHEMCSKPCSKPKGGCNAYNASASNASASNASAHALNNAAVGAANSATMSRLFVDIAEAPQGFYYGDIEFSFTSPIPKSPPQAPPKLKVEKRDLNRELNQIRSTLRLGLNAGRVKRQLQYHDNGHDQGSDMISP